MANMLLAGPNWVTLPGATVAFSGGSWETGLPLANLADGFLSAVARSTDATAGSTTLDIDLGTARGVLSIVIPQGHNLERDATWSVLGAADAGFTSVVASTGTKSVYSALVDYGALPWGSPMAWDGRPSTEDIRRGAVKVPLVHTFGAVRIARYWRIQITDETNADGWVELPFLMLTPGYQPTINLAYGVQIQWHDASERQSRLSGAFGHLRRRKYRTATFVIDRLPLGEAWANPFDIAGEAGSTDLVFFSLDPADSQNLHRHSFAGVLAAADPLELVAHEQAGVGFSIEEVTA